MWQTVKNVLLWILLIAYPVVVVAFSFAYPLFRLLRPFIINGAYYNN